MVSALGVRGGPALLREALALPFRAASRELAATLVELDQGVRTHGIASAATGALARFGVVLRAQTEQQRGPCLVLANHPGAFDALGLMSTLGRDDLAILAADREFLRALPAVAEHLLFVPDEIGARAGTLKRALSLLRRGAALLHFPAGKIEPDAAFELDHARWLEPWQPGTSALVRACAEVDGRVLVAGVSGVHSARAKRLALNRWAERRGVTTLSPLLQLTFGWRDVAMNVVCRDVAPARELSVLDADTRDARLRSALKAAISGA